MISRAATLKPRRRALAVTAAVLALGLVPAACGGDDDPTVAADDGHGHDETSEAAGDARRIEVTAKAYAFDPDEIRVTEGEEIAIALTSTDIVHDFTIDELDAHVLAKGRKTGTGGFTAGKPGRYTFYCSVAGHRTAGMEGTLVVE